MNPSIVAIDFGTSNSLLAPANETSVFDPIALDPLAKDPTIFRTLIYFPNSKKAYYGAEAISKFIENQCEGRLIRSIKRQLPIKSFVGTWIEDRPLNLDDLIGLFLKEMRDRAAAKLGKDIDVAVLGRPARFSVEDAEDKYAEFRLTEAAKKAGFKKIVFCPEPVAAAYEFREQINDTKNVLVADFGGGTSDFTVVKIGKKNFEPSDVLSIGGVPLAGDALDGSVMRKHVSPFFGADVEYKVPFGSNILKMPSHLMGKISSPGDISFLGIQDAKDFLKQVRTWALTPADREKMDRLLILIEDKVGFHVFERIEMAKRELSEKEKALIEIDYPRLELQKPISKKEFNDACQESIQSILRTLDETVKGAGLRNDQIDIVCCTGGTARVPALYEGMKERFGAEKLKQHQFFHSVVKGLAYRAKEVLNRGE